MKILVRAPNWIGDAVMAIPALEAIRAARADAEIAILAQLGVADVYRGQPFADRMMVYARRGEHAGFWGRERLIRGLRRERFDCAVLLQNAFEAAWIAWRAGIPERIGYARDARSLLLTKAIRVPAAGEIPAHESHYYLELLRRAGWISARPDAGAIVLRIDKAAGDAAEASLVKFGLRTGAMRCAMAPGAAYGSAKCWLPERYAAVADRLISEHDADVIFFGGAGEEEIGEKIQSAMRGRAISLVGKTRVSELAPLLSRCSVFLGNDSGAMHVAAAVGLPVVGIFGPTEPEGTSPVTPQFTLIREPVSCSPCFLRKCPIDHRCMTRIEADRVFRAVSGCLVTAESSRLGSRKNA